MNTQGFIKYAESKGHSNKYLTKNIRFVKRFFERIKKEDLQITKPDILKYLEYLKNERKLQNKSRSVHLIAINHYFTFLCKEGKIDKNPCLLLKIRGIKRKQLYNLYTSEELDQLFDNYHHVFVRDFGNNSDQETTLCKERNALILSIFVYQGIKMEEMNKIEISDIDYKKATLKIQNRRRGNERILPLKATQIGLLMNYLQNIRPQLVEYQTKESNKLFLAKIQNKQKPSNQEGIISAFNYLIQQIKTIDRQFINFKQVRASVITNWLKTEDLRKTQYLAGHRYVSSTERYLPNNLDDLIEDINKLHPLL